MRNLNLLLSLFYGASLSPDQCLKNKAINWSQKTQGDT